MKSNDTETLEMCRPSNGSKRSFIGVQIGNVWHFRYWPTPN